MTNQPISQVAANPSGSLRYSPRVSLDVTTLAPSETQRRLAVAACALIVGLVFVVIPFGDRITGIPAAFGIIVPALITIVVGACGMTAYLFWRQFVVLGHQEVGVLGFAFYVTALQALLRMASFPLPGRAHVLGGMQGGPWSWMIFHGLFPVFILIALLVARFDRLTPRAAVRWVRGYAIGGAVLMAVIALGLERATETLPIVVRGLRFTNEFRIVGAFEGLACASVLALLVIQTWLRSAIQLWLGVALLALIMETVVTILFPVRTGIGYWIGIVESLMGASVVGFALLHESSRLNDVIGDQRAWLTSVVDNVGDALLTFGATRTITWCNEAAARMFRADPDSIIGRQVSDWFPRIAEAGDVQGSRESLGRRSDGTTFLIELSSSVIVADESGTTTILIARDITERKHAEEALAGARDQAVTAARAMSDFLPTMSHEIRTPINAIVGMTELLMETPMSEQQREYGRTVQNSADALLSIIDDILDFSKLEAGKLELEAMPFDILTVIEGAADIVAAQARKKDLGVISFVEPSVPRHLLGDPNRLRQVLLNLLSNAVKFTEQGHVIVRATLLDETGTSAHLRFEVEDTGIGIAPEVRERLFVPFEQADQTTSRRYGGTGLGLSISRRLVALMQGTMGLTSREGEGSTFWFELPFARTSLDELPVSPSTLAGMRVLIVDDDASSRMILQEYLRAWGIVTEAVGDAKSALVTLLAAASNGSPYDVALIDYRMPESDGLSLGVAIGTDPALKKTRTVLITAFDDVGRGREAVASGFSHYLRKPVRQSILFNALTQTVAPEEREQNAVPSEARAANGRGSKILLVEDHEINRTMTLRQLDRLGFVADIASNGREAVEAIEHERYALVIMDVQMPEMDGFEATRRIRRREVTSGVHIPIIAMTANAMEGDRESCLAAGMDDYVPKPVRLDDLRRVLELYVGSAAR